MKNLYNLLILCLIFQTLNAQDTITDESVPRYKAQILEIIDRDGGPELFITPPAEDTIWDYSQAWKLPLDTGAMSMQKPDSTPFGNFFPTANYAIDLLEIPNTWGYFSIDSTGVYWMGNYHYGPFAGYNLDTTSILTPPELFIPFPFTYGTLAKDTTLGELYARLPGAMFDTNVYRKTIKYKWFEGDAYGELITPDRSFPNTLRMKTTVHQIDSDFIQNPITLNYELFSSDDYWYNIYQFLVDVRLEFPMVMQIWMTDTMDTMAENGYYRYPVGCEFYGFGIDTCVWAGDANADKQANHYDLLNLGVHYNDTTIPRDYSTNKWLGVPATGNGDTTANGEDLYHVDTNGDGIIDSSDMASIIGNILTTHGKTSSYSSSNPDLYFDVVNGDIAPGSSVEVAVMAGRDTINVYGIGFEVKVDPNLYQSNTLQLSWSNSSFGNKILSLDSVNNTSGEVWAAGVATDKVNKTGNGNFEVARLKFTVNSSVQHEAGFCINMTTNGGVDATGKTVPFNNTCDSLTAYHAVSAATFGFVVNNLDVVFSDSSTNATDWLWNFGDGDTSSLQNPSHTYAVADTYNVELVVSNPVSSDTISKSVIIDYVGLFEIIELNNIRIYPNPSSGELIIDGNSFNNDINLSIINQLGQEVYHISKAQINLLKIDLSHLENGIYLIKLSDNNKVINNKFLLFKG